MLDATEADTALFHHLSATSGLSLAAARRCVQEVLAYYDEPLQGFVVRRHRELQRDGRLKNADIYQQIIAEAQGRPFAHTGLSPRQVRRMIYG